MSKSEDQNEPADGRRVLTSAGYERYLNDLDRKGSASENVDKVDRKFLRFPEIRDAGNDGADAAQLFLRGQRSATQARDVLLSDIPSLS